MNQEGFWYAFGRVCYKYFDGLQWTYDHLSPNKILITIGFISFAWWIAWQNKFNQKQLREGGLK
ncbi:MAG TPA: hypothetical protein VFU15_06060 [Bacteroidia bacterium]|nr:hypothetical protein [Bacteroidia bacterium]